MPLELWIPSSAEERKRFLLCTICSQKFGLDQHTAWVRHTRDCANRNEDRIEAQVQEAREDPFRGLIDPERHLRERQLQLQRGQR